MGDKLNTAEHDSKGRCVRHPAIRLRKKKIFGGWKILIGHCPECCLDEMRRVRDEIGAEQDGDIHGGDRGEGRKEKKKKKKRSDRNRRDGERERRHTTRTDDSVSGVHSEGPQRSPPGRHQNSNSGGQHQPKNPHRDGESEATGSTAPNSLMDGNASVLSDPYVPKYEHHDHGRRDYHSHQAPHHQQQQQQYHNPHHQQQQQHSPLPPPPPQRTMVLSMAFTDPQTGQRGTYTGQVNSINHKPDGKGTVYYANGSIAEGSWSYGTLVESEDNQGGGYNQTGREGGDNYGGGGAYPPPAQDRARSVSRGNNRGDRDPPHGGQSSRARDGRANRGDSAPPPKSFSGNLDQLDRLDKRGGARRAPPRGQSASFHSANSQGSNHGLAQLNMAGGSGSVQNFSSGSASAQDVRPGYNSGSRSVSGARGGGARGGEYNEYNRNSTGYKRQQGNARKQSEYR